MKRMRVFLLGALAAAVSGAPPSNVTDIITLYQAPVATSLRSTPVYFKAYLCDLEAWKAYPSVTVDLIVPENPGCDTFAGKGCILAEVFDKDPIKNPNGAPLAVSYYRDPNTGIEGMPKIVFPRKSIQNEQYLWVRAFNPQGAPDLTAEIRISPTNMGTTKGKYERGIFPAASANTPTYEFQQFTRLNSVTGTVKNGMSDFLGIQFCLDLNNPAKELSISLMANDEYSAFDSYMCTDLTRTYNGACKPLGSALLCNTQGECYDNGGRPFNRMDVTDNDMKRVKGSLVMRVVGLGGNRDQKNFYTMYASLAV